MTLILRPAGADPLLLTISALFSDAGCAVNCASLARLDRPFAVARPNAGEPGIGSDTGNATLRLVLALPGP